MSQSNEYPMLVADEGPLKGQRWAVSRPLMLGREASCDVVIQDRQVSRFHARVTPTTSGVILEDLGSKNGTHHNGNPLEAPVNEGTGKPGRLVLDEKSRRVWVNQIQLVPPLSAQQFRLLSLLYENDGQVISRVDLVTAVWGEDQAAGVSDQALDALIRRLRERLSAID